MTNGSSERDKSSAQTPLWLPRGRPRGEPGGPPRGPRTTTAHMAAVRTGQCLSEVTALLPRLGPEAQRLVTPREGCPGRNARWKGPGVISAGERRAPDSSAGSDPGL